MQTSIGLNLKQLHDRLKTCTGRMFLGQIFVNCVKVLNEDSNGVSKGLGAIKSLTV
jgi:hypothetical protein